MKQKRWIAVILAMILAAASISTGGLNSYAEEGSSWEDAEGIIEEIPEIGDITGTADEPDETEAYDADEDAAIYADYAEPDEITPDDEDPYEEETPSAEPLSEEVEEDTDEPLGAVVMTLDANGGTFPDGKDTYELSYLTQYLSSYTPERDGFIFTGWYKEQACNTLLSDSYSLTTLETEPEEGAIIYAGWSEYYTLTFIFGTDTGDDPVKNTGYYWDTSSNPDRRVKQLQYKVAKGNTLTYQDYPSDTSYIRNTDLHYSINAWYTNEDRTGTGISYYNMAGQKPESDMTYYAGYTNDEYVVTVHANSDTAYFTKQDDYGETAGSFKSYYKRVPKSSAASFDIYCLKNSNARMATTGFYKDADGKQALEVNQYGNPTFTADTTLYVGWAATNKVATFDANGGYFFDYNYDTSESEEIEGPETIGFAGGQKTHFEPDNIDHEDVTLRFMGWSTSKTGEIEHPSYESSEDPQSLTFYDEKTEDVTYYARWEKKYLKATFDATSAGTFEYSGHQGKKTVEKADYRVKLNGRLDDYPDRVDAKGQNKIFTGWYDGDKEITYLYSYTFTKDTTVTAHYATACTITLVANGGYFEENEEKVTQKAVKAAVGAEIYLNSPETDEDLEFGGWYQDAACTKPIVMNGSYGSWFIPTKDETFYAKWLHRYKVTFDMGAGTLNGKTKKEYTVREGSTFGNSDNSMPNDPTPNNESQAFSTWCTDDILESPITREEILSWTVTENVTFYAKYANAYTVTFNANGGSFASVSEGQTYQVKVAEGETLKGKYPTMVSTEEKVFQGWFTGQEATQEQEVKNIYSYTVDKDVTLYAGYTECYILTFHANAEGATLDGDKTEVKVKVTKGTAYRFGQTGKTKDELFVAPKLSYEKVNGLLPVVKGGTSYSNSSSEDEPLAAWTTNQDGSGRTYYFARYQHCYTENGETYYYNMYGFVPTSNMDFYVKWGEPVTITFDPNGATFLANASENKHTSLSGNKRTMIVPKGMTFNDIHRPSTGSSYLTMPADKNGGSFSYLTADGKTIVPWNNEITKDTTIYASWYKSGSGGGGSTTPTKKQLTLHANEGYFGDTTTKTRIIDYTVSSTSMQYTQIPDIDDPALAFSGWYTDEAATKRYNPQYQFYNSGTWYIVIPKEISDLYAGYAPTTTVILDANGGYFDADEDRIKDPKEQNRNDVILRKKVNPAGEGIVISEYTKRIRRDGERIFIGWYYDAAGTEKATLTSCDASNEYFVPEGDSETTRIYAKWALYEKPEEVKTTDTSVTLKIGASKQLSASTVPDTIPNTQDVHWFVNSYSINSSKNQYRRPPVSLTSDGLVTGMFAGQATVYAECNGVRSNLVSITVSDKEVTPELTGIDPSSLTLVKESSAVVRAVVSPESAGSKITWKSSDTKIAKVAGNGATATITAVSKGNVTITATLDKKSVTMKVTVADKQISLSPATMILTSKAGVTADLQATVSVPELQDSEIVWTLSEENIVTLTADPSDDKKAVVDPADDLTETKEVTVRAAIKDTEYYAECVITVNPQNSAKKPAADPAGGVVTKNTLVSLTSATIGAEIYYTTDDSEPTAAAENLYTDPILITEDMTIKAFAIKEGYKQSETAVFSYTVNKEDWGDADDELIKHRFPDASEIPEGIWYVIDQEIFFESAETSKRLAFTGGKQTFNDEISVYQGTKKLIENRDYTLSYANNTAVASNDARKAPSVTVNGKGNYKSKAVFKFSITKANIRSAVITSETLVTAKKGTKLSKIVPSLTFAGKKLKLGKDYDLIYYRGEDIEDNSAIIPKPSDVSVAEGDIFTILLRGHSNKDGVFVGSFEDIDNDRTIKVTGLTAGTVAVSGLKVSIPAQARTGEKIEVSTLFDNTGDKTAPASVKAGKTMLIYDTDFTVEEVEGTDYTSAGKHKVLIRGKGEKYTGVKTVTFEIKAKAAAKKIKVGGLASEVEYQGGPFTLEQLNKKDKSGYETVTLYTVSGKTKTPLTAETDYTVALENNRGITGSFNVVFTLKGDYTGTIRKTVKVKAYDIGKDARDVILVEAADAVYSKAGAKPAVIVSLVTVKDDDGTPMATVPLTEGVDYTVSYANNGKVQTDKTASKAPCAVVKGKGSYTGINKKATFAISKADASGSLTLSASDVVYSTKKGKYKVTPKITDGGKAVSVGKKKEILSKTAFRYYYAEDAELANGDRRYLGEEVGASDIVPVNTLLEVRCTVKTNPNGPYVTADSVELNGYYRIIKTDIKGAKVQFKKGFKPEFKNGEPIVPIKAEHLIVTVKKKPLETTDYEVVSVSNNRFLGTATIVIRGKAPNFGGTKTVTFKVAAASMK